MSFNWIKRQSPLAPEAVLLPFSVQELMARIQPLPGWLVFGSPGECVVRSPENELPWFDGCEYLGIDPLWPGLFLPTKWQPVLPQRELLVKALQTQGFSLPAVLSRPNRLLTLGQPAVKL